MKNSKLFTYYIESLTVISWVFFILPYFLNGRMRTLQATGQIYYFNTSRAGLRLANFTLWFTKKQLQRADFRQGDTRDQNGNLIWMKTMEDALSIRNDIKNNSEFPKTAGSYAGENNLRLFLSKWAMCYDFTTLDAFLILKFIFWVRSVENQEKLNDPTRVPERQVFLFMQERPWFAEIGRFVRSKGINVIPVGNLHFHVKAFVLQFDDAISFVQEFCKKVEYYWMVTKFRLREPRLLKRANNGKKASDAVNNEGNSLQRAQPCIAVEHYGSLNFNSPEAFSDLFFLRKSSIFRDILIYFGLSKAPITDKDWKEIRERGMSAVAINPRASATPDVPLLNHKRERIKTDWRKGETKEKKDIFTHKWLEQHIFNYHQRYDYWVDFITRCNVKVHVTWFKYSPEHGVLLEALKDTGGIGTVYQRSFEHSPAHWTFTRADVVFGFSEMGAHLGRDQESRIPYYVVTGYLGDYRFGLLKRGNDVRKHLKDHGAQKILVYFDEHASNHLPWNLSYNVTLRNHAYLLKQVLDNPWLGLILKPKVPSTLRSRLGPVSELLRRAEKTGRCFVFEDEDIHCSYPPAVACLGADTAIHGHFFAATAGIESALAGIPTLLLDSEGVIESPLHSLGEGRVIFKDIEPLWRSCVEHWSRPGGIPGFADWSGMLNELDPFRDGRAAERMENYLHWLIEGFKAKLPRETVLADAAQRYSDIWGKDKILSVNVPSKADPSKGHLTPIGQEKYG